MNTESKGLRAVARHIHLVQSYMSLIVTHLQRRMIEHDQSKYSQEELGLVEAKPKLDALEFMSESEREILDGLQHSLKNHYKLNDHHPEHWENGIKDMCFISILEMMCDWKAASDMSKSGNYQDSINFCCERFSIPDETKILIENTARRFGWVE